MTLTAAFLAQKLRRPFLDAGYGLRLFDGTRDSLRGGLAYHLAPCRGPSIHDAFLWELGHLRATVKDRRGKVILVVHWPSFLREGCLPAGLFSRAAHHLLEALLPLICHFDAVLADELRSMRRRVHEQGVKWADEHPFDLGQIDTDSSEDRFSRHLERLLKDREFLRLLRNSIASTFPGTTRGAMELGLTSKELDRQLLREMTFFENRTLALVNDGAVELSLPEGQPLPTEGSWQHEYRRLAESFCGTDGAWLIPGIGRRMHQLLVNWDAVVAQATAVKRPSALLDALAQGTGDHRDLGHRARELFAKKTNNRFLAPRYDRLLSEVVQEKAKVVLGTSFEHGWELYSATSLRNELRFFQRRVFESHKAAQEKEPKPASPAAFALLNRSYDGINISIGRYAGEIVFTVPYDVPEAFLNPVARRHRGYHYAGSLFWNLRGINLHASGFFRPGDRQIFGIDEAEPFFRWASEQEAELVAPGAFTKAVFASNRAVRVGAFKKGVRKHIGPFTVEEDAAIRAFCEKRTSGPLSAAEKQALAAVVPGRTVAAALERRDHCGYQYAIRNGWVAYAKSGYCSRVTAHRRAEWLKRGVPVLNPHEAVSSAADPMLPSNGPNQLSTRPGTPSHLREREVQDPALHR